MTQSSICSSTSDNQPYSPEEIQKEYDAQMVEMGKIENSEGPGAAIVYIMTTLLFTVSAYEESEEAQVGSIMQTLQNVQNETSNIQDDFNQENSLNTQFQAAMASNNSAKAQQIYAEEQANVEDAINNAVDIENQLGPNGVGPDSNPFSSISTTTADDLNTIFGNQRFSVSNSNQLGGPYRPDYKHVDSIITSWNDAWTPPSNTSENTNLQPTTDAFNSMQSSVSGLSSSMGTQLQYWQGDDQQTNSLTETIMQSFMQLLTTVINGFKSS